MLKMSISKLFKILPAAVMAARQYYSIRHAMFICIIIINCLNATAQIAMPDSVCLGATKHYNVDYNSFSGSTYTWKIDGVIQNGTVLNEIDITWNTIGTFILSVQEINSNGCQGPQISGLVVVDNCNSADLSVLNTVNNEHPFIGNNIQFTITATNNSLNSATGVMVTDFLPYGYTYVSSTTSSGLYDNQTGEWNIGTMLTGESSTLTIIATVNATGSYSTTATISGIESESNLENNVSSNITYPEDFFIPDAFSPNGDGINDKFVIRGILNFPLNKFLIYNRWGNKVYEASPYINNWDGRSMFGIVVGGNELPTGTYFYLLDLGKEIKIIKGTIYLNR